MTDQPQHPTDEPVPGSVPPPPPQGFATPEQAAPAAPPEPAAPGQVPPPVDPAQQGYAQQGYQQGYQQQGYQQQGYPVSGQAPLSPNDEKTWSIAAHLSPFLASLIGLPFLGPLVIYLVFKDRGPFIRHHAAQALNFQIIVAIGLLISIPLMFVLIGFVTAAIIAVAAIVLQIVAAIEANNGKWYRYPMTPDWVK
ncbi:MAG TPA: DUF4870 domain-containing protein [Pedococcus sp.]|jgi:hypothetical protein